MIKCETSNCERPAQQYYKYRYNRRTAALCSDHLLGQAYCKERDWTIISEEEYLDIHRFLEVLLIMVA